MGIMKKRYLFLPRKTLLTIYVSFVRPNLDYADIVYDKRFNESFKTKIKIIQYRSVLVISGAIESISHDSLYQELGLGSLTVKSSSWKLFFFHKIVNVVLPSYLQSCLNDFNE